MTRRSLGRRVRRKLSTNPEFQKKSRAVVLDLTHKRLRHEMRTVIFNMFASTRPTPSEVAQASAVLKHYALGGVELDEADGTIAILLNLRGHAVCDSMWGRGATCIPGVTRAQLNIPEDHPDPVLARYSQFAQLIVRPRDWVFKRPNPPSSEESSESAQSAE